MNVAKALAIIAVVVGHTDPPIFSIIYNYHMALFFFIMGYLYKDNDSREPWMLVKKRLRSLYLPFVRFNLLFLLFHNLFFFIFLYSDQVNFNGTVVREYTSADLMENAVKILFFKNTEQLVGVLWFLRTLFLVNVVFCLIRFAGLMLLKRYEQFTAIAVLVLFAIGVLMSLRKDIVSAEMARAFVSLFIFYLGFLYRRSESVVPMKAVFAIGFGALFVLLSSYGTVMLVYVGLVNPAFFVAASILGIYVNIYLAKTIARTRAVVFFDYLGQQTLVVLAFHLLAFKIITWLQVIVQDQPLYKIASFPVLSGAHGWWIVYTMAGLLVPLLLLQLRNGMRNLIWKPKTALP